MISGSKSIIEFAKARERMVREQIIARGVKDPKVIEAMRKVPRHLFVEEALQNSAYGDYPLPIGEGQTISQPYMVALMTECLQLSGTEKVLEIGTGSGYQAAILAEITEKVYSIERAGKLAARARQVLDSLGYTNINIRVGDGTYGWPEQAPFDRIIVTAGAPNIPQILLDQLKDGGKMVIPVGGAYSQMLTLAEKEEGKVKTTDICGCVFVPLVGDYGWKE